MSKTHYAYDYGVLDFLGKTKTKTTLCGKVVAISRIDNENPTCPDCQQEHQEDQAMCILLQAKDPSLTGHINGQSIEHL